VVYLSDWVNFFRNKLWSQVDIKVDRKMAAFWFVIAGPLIAVIGLLIYDFELKGLLLPINVGWILLSIAILGAVMSPKSGFTFLLIPQAIYYLLSAYQQ
jgi:hypothetical protein